MITYTFLIPLKFKQKPLGDDHYRTVGGGGGGLAGEVTFLGKRDRKMGYQGGVFYNVQKYTGPLVQFSKLSKPLRRK